MASILLIFTVLAIIFYAVFTSTNRQQQADQLLSGAEALAELVLPDFTLSAGTSFVGSTAADYINFTARSENAMVWVVNAQGELAYCSALPEESAEKLTVSPDSGRLRLPSSVLNTSRSARTD